MDMKRKKKNKIPLKCDNTEECCRLNRQEGYEM